MSNINRRAFLFALPVVACALPALAKKDKVEQYKPNSVISDGKKGRRWGQFNQTLPEKSFYQAKVQMKRVSGGDDTYVNLRFGRDGQTLDGAKRVYLKNDQIVEETWTFDRTVPNGKPLILNAYNGEVQVLRVLVWHD